MYIDPGLGKPLLDPLFQLQASPNYSVQYAAGDLGMSHKDNIMSHNRVLYYYISGSSYPNVSASMSIHQHGVERLWITPYCDSVSLNSV